MTEDPTLQAVIDFHAEMLAELEEDFSGDEMPVESIATIVRRAAEFETIFSRFVLATADEEQDSPSMDALCSALEEQAVDMLAALSALEYEYDLNISDEFVKRREATEALQDAETVEELQEALEDSGVQVAGFDQLAAGDNVDMEGYDPEGRGRDVY